MFKAYKIVLLDPRLKQKFCFFFIFPISDIRVACLRTHTPFGPLLGRGVRTQRTALLFPLIVLLSLSGFNFVLRRRI